MFAQLISSIGDWLSIVAIITLVGLKWNATPMEVSFVILCLALPMVIFGPLAGVVADRMNRKALMIISDLIRALLILLLSMAETIEVVYICLLLIGIFSTIFIPAKNGKLKELVAEEHMTRAMSISAAIDSITKVLGPLLSGGFVLVFGAKLVFYIDSATFLISAVLIALLPKATHVIKVEETVEKDRTSIKTDLLLGLSFIRSNTSMLVGMFFLGMSLLILQLSDSQLIVLIREISDATPNLFGYVVMASGIGMFFSGILLAKKTQLHSMVTMLIGVCGIGIGFGMMGVFTYFDTSYPVVWIVSCGLWAGFSINLVFVPFQAYIQLETPVQMTGRVFGVMNSVTTTATIVGPILGGWLSTVVGVVPTFMTTAALLILMALIGLAMKSKRERRERDVSESEQATSRGTTS
ncbi:MFS transporter [Bacillus solimangrovi]|uniref:MFS transporter n=2 Tax=Bacillus solimangrovi TaxID=1305675 RepID=A0A1E5LG56_9BACI|nr:MFS transporter [Bacillus solimangrovi]